jgi:translation initiation factor 2-alpha kinase 4
LAESAFEKAKSVKNAFQTNMPVLAVDVSLTHFEAMIRHPSWITDEEAWKVLNASFPNPPGYPGYHYSIREAVQRRKSEGHAYLLLFAVREDRVQLLSLG